MKFTRLREFLQKVTCTPTATETMQALCNYLYKHSGVLDLSNNSKKNSVLLIYQWQYISSFTYNPTPELSLTFMYKKR